MKDLDYFIATASNSTQREFELDFADVIEVYDTNETTITTECGRTVIITWEDNYFKSYHVIYETALMESSFKRGVVLEIIKKLQAIDVDGETMQYIIEKVGMVYEGRDKFFGKIVIGILIEKFDQNDEAVLKTKDNKLTSVDINSLKVVA